MRLFTLLFCLFTTGSLLAQNADDLTRKYELDIWIHDRETYEDLNRVKVKLINVSSGKVDSTMAIGSHATFTIDKCNTYEILVLKNGYLNRRGTFDAACYQKDAAKRYCLSGMNILNVLRMSGEYDARLELEMPVTRLQLDQVFRIENIYYDYNQSYIRPDAAKELDKLVVILKDNPGISVELGSHTDSRSSTEYNQQLSQKRAEAAVAYIIEHGIPSSRITAKGYGESKLINRCKDGVKCSEAEHQQNRRTEVRITGIVE
ncbi:MAG: OmpA family protein [Spirosomataceae bacterium]